ncbi:OmpH family outer membrane protein [Bacteroides sp. 51]|uniref:OmpH family outer membrane protein n=1 Tax=Bacteroides sp. 51 TaxID=2302938 RepID=UPI0013D55FA9|nr:OmpH family outer membrane protein [Bacteroides sp. 51]NDV83928.1 OmpH family outer membrane protein [Bacteroides sp. 51]
MLKKIALVIMLIIPMGVFAQTVKFGHVYSQEIIVLMPEYTKAVSDIQALENKYKDEMQRTNEELTKKYQEFQQAVQEGSLPANIQERRQKEIQDMAERSEQFQQDAYQELQRTSQELMAPISKKVEDAIKAVGQEESMVYVFDLSRTYIPFVNDKLSVDITTKVKTRVGIK